MKVGIVGGTGRFGSALGARLAQGGASVVLGARDVDRAIEVAAAVDATGGTIADAAECEVVVMTVPASAIPHISDELRFALANKTVVSPINNLSVVGGEMFVEVVRGASCAEALQAALPDSDVVTAFNHIPANVAANLGDRLDADVLICADSEHALNDARRLVSMVDGLRPEHVGSLAMSAIVESFTAVIINVNKRERRNASVCLSEQGTR